MTPKKFLGCVSLYNFNDLGLEPKVLFNNSNSGRFKRNAFSR